MKIHPYRYSNRIAAAAIISLLAVVPLSAQSEPETTPGAAEPVEVNPKVVQAEPLKDDEEAPKPTLAIGSIIAGSQDFTTLSGALKAAGLEKVLGGDTQLTLLAPNNAAFAALPRGVVRALLMPENRATLRAILEFHVIPSKIMASEFVPGELKTAQGESMMIVGGPEDVMTVQGAKFGIKDVGAKNGVIQVIDKVLVPPTIDIKKFATPGATTHPTPTPTPEPGDAEEP